MASGNKPLPKAVLTKSNDEIFFIFYFKYIYTGYNQSVTNCYTLEPCPKKNVYL